MPVIKANNEKTENLTTNQKTIYSFKPQNPRYDFDDLIISEKIYNDIHDVLCFREKSDLVFKKWGLEKTHKYYDKVAINLYGKPGTGKTMAAHAIANHYKKKIIEVNYSEIESKYVGETPKNLTRVFKEAEESDSILFFDEADAILSRRVTNMTNSTDTSVNQTRSVMLILLNNFKGFIVFATNFIENFDPAFMRRILSHIYFDLPDFETRKRLWRHYLQKKLPHDVDIDIISEKYENISGSDISNTVLKASFKAARKNEKKVKQIYFEEAIEEILDSKNKNEGYKVEKTKVTEEYVKNQINN